MSCGFLKKCGTSLIDFENNQCPANMLQATTDHHSREFNGYPTSADAW